MDVRPRHAKGRTGVTPIVRLAVAAMATRFELVLGGSDLVALRAAGEEALVEIEACEAAWNRFRADSEISRVNRLACTTPVAVSWEFVEILGAALSGAAATDGAFDPTAGSAEGVTWRDVALDARSRSVAFTRSGVRLDFGAIAKGAALDRAATLLREAGVVCGLIHGGTSSVVAIGAPSGADGFGIALPGEASVALRDASLSVSRTDGRVDAAGRSHVVDPRSGRPLDGSRAVAVVAPTGTIAEIWSTALLVDPGLSIPKFLSIHRTGDAPSSPFVRHVVNHAPVSGAEISSHEFPIAS